MTELDIHPYEKAGLGKAPFRYIGMTEKVYVACPGATPQPGGTCDYCGNGIRYVFRVQSADGKTFGVGCECIHKVDRACLVNQTQFERDLREHKKKQARLQRQAKVKKEEERIEAAFAFLDGNQALQAKLKAIPHPVPFRREKGETLADHVAWMRDHAGHSGRLQMARMLEKLSAEPASC